MCEISLRKKVLQAAGCCLAVGGVTMAVLFAVYAIRGIWPFGSDNIAYVDTAQFYLESYYRLWDALHGAPLNVNWAAGLAERGNATITSFLLLPDLVFLLVPRDHILEGLSLYLAARLLIVSFAAGLAVHLRFGGLRFVWRVALASLYTLSGFVLQYYCNFFWLWTAALFPLLLYALERLLREGKYILYCLLYAYLVYESVYFTYMITAYILLFAFAYVLFLLPKELRGDRVFRLGMSTAAAAGIAASGWIPGASSLTGTSRFQSNLDTGLLEGITTWDITATRHTLVMLLGMALAIAILIRALRRRRFLTGPEREGADRRLRFFLFLAVMLGIPMIFTNIDTAWHFGQYNYFPMRYGFVVPATLLSAAAVSLGHEREREEPVLPAAVQRRHTVLTCAAAVVVTAALCLLEPRLTAYYREYGTVFLTAFSAREYWLSYFPPFAGCGVLLIILYLLLLRIRPERLAVWLTAAAVVLQLGVNASGLIAPDDSHTASREYDPSFVETADALYEYFSDNEPGALSRAKNADGSLGAGYPVMAGVSAVSSVASENSDLRLGVYRELGYSIEYFRILDTGGTVLSDMMLGVDITLTGSEPDPTLYEDTGTVVDGIHIGRTRYPGCIGLTYDEDDLSDYLDELTFPGRYDKLYRAFTGSDASIAFTPRIALSAEGEGIVHYTLTITVEEEAMIYLASDELLMALRLNGERFTVPTYQNLNYVNYPATFNSNFLYLGTCRDETLTLEFNSGSGITEDNFTVLGLRKALVDTFRTDTGADAVTVTGGVRGESVEITVPKAEAGKRLFLPLTYSRRWIMTVNGEPVEVARVMGTFCSVPLEEGENVIRIERGPARHTFSTGDLISCVSIVLCAVWLVLRRRLQPQVPRWMGTSALTVFCVVTAAVVVMLYVVPAVLFLQQGVIKPF